MLDLRTWTWTRLAGRRWQQWAFHRTDRTPNHLWILRLALWMREVQCKEKLPQALRDLVALTGHTPNLDLIPFLYSLDGSATELPPNEDEHDVFRILIDGVVVRFTEEPHLVRATVEGTLSEERLGALQYTVRNNLSALEDAAWEIETLG